MARAELLTIKQATAEMGGVARATFYRWRTTGKFPKSVKLPNGQTYRCVKLPNGEIRIPRPLLEHFLTTCHESD